MEFKTENIRNIALIGHGDSGKTTLAEGILFAAKESKRFGSVDDGSTISDYNPDEIERKISINSSLLHCEWNNNKINIVDTPGYMDFTGEVIGALHAVELGVLVVNAVSGVEVGTEIVWGYCKQKNMPRIIIINKLDKEHANFQKIFDQLKNQLSKKVIPVQFSINEGVAFESVIDVVNMKMLKFSKDQSGNFTENEIPAEHKDRAESLHQELKEISAESDDELLEKYLEEGDLTNDEFKKGLRSAIASGEAYPVLCAAAENNMGAKSFLGFLTDYCPSPKNVEAAIGKHPGTGKEVTLDYDSGGPCVVQVFKTISEQHVGELSFFKCFSGIIKPGIELMNTNKEQVERIGQLYTMNGHSRKEIAHIEAGDIGAVVKLKNTHTGDTLSEKSNPMELQSIEFPSPVIRSAVVAKVKGDEEKISAGLQILHEEDPSFMVNIDGELKQIIISGQGEMHLDIVVKRLKHKMGVDVVLEDPHIPYRETIRSSVKMQGKYKKQSGGRGQYGDAWIEIKPQSRGGGFEFENKIVGGSIPTKYIPAVEKGIVEAMVRGVWAGFMVVDVKVTLYDGSFHNVDSSDMAFKIAGSMAFKKAFMEAKPVLLEPIYEVEVMVPEEFMGDVMGDLSGRRGKIQGMDSDGSMQKIKALIPLAELYKYSTSLRSITSGRGMHRRKFSGYEQVPKEIAEKIVSKSSDDKEE